jgi:fructosamine-3-kinase
VTDLTVGVDARTVLRRVVQSEDPAEITFPAQGNHKETIVAHYADRPAAVVQLTDDPDAAHVEASLLSAIRDWTDVPVPALLARGSLGGRGYLVTEYVTGRDLHQQFTDLDGATRERLARRFGAILAQLHEAFSFDTAGPIALDETGRLEATGPPADEFGRQYARDGLTSLPPAFDDRHSEIESALNACPETTRTPRLFPWDLRPGNALLADDEIAAVTDWGEPLAADPSLAVAKAEHLVANWYVDDPAPLRRAFGGGYESVRPLPEVPVADRIAAVVQSAVDSTGTVTRPRYPELTGEDAVAVHRGWLDEWL